jgi:hypothetical protein
VNNQDTTRHTDYNERQNNHNPKWFRSHKTRYFSGQAASWLFGGVISKLYLFAIRQQPPKIWRHRSQLHGVDFVHSLQERFTEAMHPVIERFGESACWV